MDKDKAIEKAEALIEVIEIANFIGDRTTPLGRVILKTSREFRELKAALKPSREEVIQHLSKYVEYVECNDGFPGYDDHNAMMSQAIEYLRPPND